MSANKRHRYSDVSHEVKAVVSGYRLVFTYNLIKNKSSREHPSSEVYLAGAETKLQEVLANWNSNYSGADFKGPNVWAYKLAHKYTNASLRFDLLKGVDQVRARYLKGECENEDFCLYLANLERKVWGQFGGEGTEYWGNYPKTGKFYEFQGVVDDTVHLQNVVDLAGTVVSKGFILDEGNIVQTDNFKVDPGEEEYEGETGNEGVESA